LRGHAKGVNFGLCYGGGGQAVVAATHCDKNEGWRIKNAFDKTYTGLRAWWDMTHKFARKHGFVRTAFGRKYPLPDINSPDGFFKSKAERNAVNGPIQGSGADVIKIAMSLVYRECKKRGWLEKCMMVASMHDELVFEIDADILEEALPLIVKTMSSNNIILGKNWIIPLTCDVEIGDDWTVPWDINGMTYKEVRFLGNKKLKDEKKCPEGVDFNSLPSWPDELKPWFRAARGENADSPLNTYVPGPVSDASATAVAVAEGVTTQALSMATEAPVSHHAMQVASIAHLGMPKSMDNTNWEFKLDAILTPDTVSKLARVIVKNRGRGMTPLKIRLVDGSYLDLDHYLSQNGVKTPILVNPLTFEAAALDHGLIR
jgi:hypothetical protein